MKKQNYLLSFVFVLTLSQWTFAEDQVINLKDGSQVKGELTSVANGTYTVHTATMGDVKVDAAQVNSISNGSMPAAAANAPSPDEMNQKIQNAQNKLMNDPQMVSKIQDMMKDPDLMKLLSDPVLVQAVMSHDVKAIEANPQAKELMNNPKMRALLEEMHANGYGQ